MPNHAYRAASAPSVVQRARNTRTGRKLERGGYLTVETVTMWIVYALTLIGNAVIEGGRVGGTTSADIAYGVFTWFTPAGYVFAIWSLIYVAMVVWLVAYTRTAPVRADRFTMTSILFIASCALNVLWLALWHFELVAVSFIVILAEWLVLAALVGCVVGPLGGAFGLALNGANATRGAHPWLLYLLPVAGLVIVFLYHRFDPDGGGSTNQIFVSVREHKPLTLRTAPLIFVSTVATHLFGGSSGREGAALLLGGSVSGQLGRALRLENRDCRLMTMCGMAGAFSAIFGTPLAATIFTLEVVDVGSMQYAALLPCLVSALLGVFISGKMGLAPEAFVLQAEAAPTPDNLVRVIILGALLAALSIFFCELLHVTPKLYRKFFPNIYLRVAAGGVLIIALTRLLGTTDYNGAGAAVIEAAIDGEAVPYAFLLKMLFTALTLGAGFKGGEIVPIFFTGATFGCVAAPLLGLPPQLGAALGMVALFCGCTNSPLASICLAIEVFGGQCVSLFALACAVSYMLSSYFSLYREQHFLHSKLRIVGVQRVHGHWSETDAAHLTTNDDGEN